MELKSLLDLFAAEQSVSSPRAAYVTVSRAILNLSETITRN
ncbi:MAG: hypothetical protein ACPGVU_09885 [Limisphaerales bacterium]